MNGAQERLARALYARHAAAAYPHALAAVDGDRARARYIMRAALANAVRQPTALANADVRAWLVAEVRRLAAPTRPASRPWYRKPRLGPSRAAAESQGTNAARHGPKPRSTIAEGLAELPPAHRAAIEETFLKGRSVQQAADLLGVTPQAMKSHVHYGLHRLVLILEEQESAW